MMVCLVYVESHLTGDSFSILTASFVIPGYDVVGFNDSAWSPAAVVTGSIGVLVNHRGPPTRVIQQLTPVSVTEPVSGIYVVAFERNVVGWVRLSATGEYFFISLLFT